MQRIFFLAIVVACCPAAALTADDRPFARLPKPGGVVTDKDRGEVILSATVQHTRDKPCIDDWGERIQAFVGCAKAAGGDAKMAGYFVFLVDVPTEDVYDALIKLGAKTRVSYSMEVGHKRSGLKPETTPADYLQGEPVYAVAFAPDGKRLASAGEDHVVRLWDTEGKEVGRLKGHKEAVYAATFSPDGKRLATAGADKAIRLWGESGAKP